MFCLSPIFSCVIWIQDQDVCQTRHTKPILLEDYAFQVSNILMNVWLPSIAFAEFICNLEAWAFTYVKNDCMSRLISMALQRRAKLTRIKKLIVFVQQECVRQTMTYITRALCKRIQMSQALQQLKTSCQRQVQAQSFVSTSGQMCFVQIFLKTGKLCNCY